MEDLSGKELGQYRIIAPFGEGGMAAVYKAFQPGTERYVALKILPRHYSNDPAFRERFQQEAQIIAKFQHPHILPVFDYGEEDGYAYLAMPLVTGGNLARRLHGDPLELQQVRDITAQIGDALDYAHTYGVIHRDVKPSNILIDERGNALLADFGIAKIVGDMANITGTGQTVGTPAYMSPEQIKGESLDGRSDVYSLGIVLYEMVTGRTPFRAETPPALYVKHLLDPLPPPSSLQPTVPEGVEKVILKSLAKNPDDRFATAADMAAAIKRAIDADPQQTMNAAVVLPPGVAAGMEKTEPDAVKTPAAPARSAAAPAPVGKRRVFLWAAMLLAAIIATALISRALLQRDADPAAGVPAETPVEVEAARYVDGSSGTDEGECSEPDAPCLTINYAVAKAESGDDMLVTGGEYVENVKLLAGKTLAIRGGLARSGATWTTGSDRATVINGGGADSTIEIRNDSNTILENVTVTGGMGLDDPDFGAGCGGFKIQDSNVEIRQAAIINNSSGPGQGGALCAAGDGRRITLLIEETIISGNRAADLGGALNLFNTKTTVVNSLIVDNETENNLASVLVLWKDDDVTLINSTVADNNPTGDQAVLLFSGKLTLLNSIMWNNALNLQADPPCPSCFEVSYSNVQGVSSGDGNIDEDPLFRTAPAADYRLTEESPCIDAGSGEGAPQTDIEGTPRDARPDMGAYEYVTR